MRYYRVRPSHAGEPVYRFCRGELKVVRYLIANELYTPAEVRYWFAESGIGAVMSPADTQAIFEAVEVPKSQIYTLFGARFQIQED